MANSADIRRSGPCGIGYSIPTHTDPNKKVLAVIAASTFDRCAALPLRCLFGMAPIRTQTIPVQAAMGYRFRFRIAPELESPARSALVRSKDPKGILAHPLIPSFQPFPKAAAKPSTFS